ncbi:MAG TPA: ABC transporter ATP-binding protein [Vineibacter sp.]|nr:ABC transporter ATP-binding protein [Vineibacter sp.]
MLSLANLAGGYGLGNVIDGITLDVRPGETLAVLGRNGSGKSTMIKAIMGLLPAAVGSVRLDDTALLGLPTHRIARLGVAYVPQGRGIFPRLTVLENLQIGARAGGPRHEVPDDVVALFPFLRQRYGQFGGTMSGGEQQMLAIARALCARPRFLLMDEPSDGVQPSIVQTIAALIPDIARTRKLGVILVEQNLDLALSAAQRVAVLDKGRIAHECVPDAFRDPAIQAQFLAV